MGEMISDRPIFPGSSTMNQLERIIALTGKPSSSDVDAINSPFALTMLDSIPPTKKTTLNEIFPKAAPEAIDLMEKVRNWRETGSSLDIDATITPTQF